MTTGMPAASSCLPLSSDIPPIRRDIPHERAAMHPQLHQRMREVVYGQAPWPLLLLGGVGVGKTCAALCLLDVVYGGRVYMQTAELAQRIAAARCSDNPGSEWRFWEDWEKAKLVCLDEMGERMTVSDSAYGAVKRAIDLRLGKPAIYISNLKMSELAEVFDARIVSRLGAGTRVEMWDWPDRRRTERQPTPPTHQAPPPPPPPSEDPAEVERKRQDCLAAFRQATMGDAPTAAKRRKRLGELRKLAGTP